METSTESNVESIPESAHDCTLDSILYDWRVLAAIGWQGAMTKGRGVVVVSVGEKVDFDYYAGAPCSCHAQLVNEYDPEQQIVIMVRWRNGENIYLLGGDPTPPQAFESATADLMNATIQ